MLFLYFIACGESQKVNDVQKNVDISLSEPSIEPSIESPTESSIEPSTELPQYDIERSQIYTQVADAICQKISTCCDEASQEYYFRSFIDRTDLQDIASQLPPNTPFNLETCLEYMPTILDRIWLGAWISQYEAELVSYNQIGFNLCLEELNSAACGQPARDSLFDPECFGSDSPAGGEEQRQMFDRTAQSGNACKPLADGFGGLYFGSCDPKQAFCCVDDPYGNQCNPYPVPEDEGLCEQASQIGEACSQVEPMQLCATGLECSYSTGLCEASSELTLQVGDVCYDSVSYSLIGECQESWCDLLGSGNCETLRSSDENCQWDESCSTGYCDIELGQCTENPICSQ